MAGTITQEHIEYVRETFGQDAADKLAVSNSPTFLAFLVENNLI